ncbi:hypothetical protein [uncultured Treponema sp.]
MFWNSFLAESKKNYKEG